MKLVTLITITFLSLACTSACNRGGEDSEPASEQDEQEPEADEVSSVELDIELSPEEETAAAELLAELRSREGEPDEELLGGEGHGRLLVYLAGAHGDDPHVLEWALMGMSLHFERTPGEADRLPIDEDYRRLVRAHLRSSEPGVAGRAVVLADRLLMEDPIDEVVGAALAALIRDGDNPAAQYSALYRYRSLFHARPFIAHPPMIEATVEATLAQDDPYVLVQALELLQKVNDPLSAELHARAIALLGHDDEAVRARAAGLLAAQAEHLEEDGSAAEALSAVLEDESRGVRVQAVDAYARVRGIEAIPELVPHLADSRGHTMGQKDIPSLPGTGDYWSSFSGKSPSFVARNAIVRLGRVQPREQALKMPEFDTDDEASVAAAQQAILSWYEAYREGLE